MNKPLSGFFTKEIFRISKNPLFCTELCGLAGGTTISIDSGFNDNVNKERRKSIMNSTVPYGMKSSGRLPTYYQVTFALKKSSG